MLLSLCQCAGQIPTLPTTIMHHPALPAVLMSQGASSHAPPPSRHPAGGHYTADVLQPDGCWLHFNDHQVDVVPVSQVLAEKTYLLFYQKV